jgi:hypothetical protein
MRVLKLLSAIVVLGAAYVAWPIYSALQIRDAIHSGDTATLARKIEWESVRASLKASLSAETLARLEADPNGPKPSLWQRIKAVVTPKMADGVIDRYVTPQNLPYLFGIRQAYRVAAGSQEPATVLAGTWLSGTPVDRLASFYRRIRRAVFYSPTRFEIEVVDKYEPERRYIGMLELRGLDWKLTGLTISGAGL